MEDANADGADLFDEMDDAFDGALLLVVGHGGKRDVEFDDARMGERVLADPDVFFTQARDGGEGGEDGAGGGATSAFEGPAGATAEGVVGFVGAGKASRKGVGNRFDAENGAVDGANRVGGDDSGSARGVALDGHFHAEVSPSEILVLGGLEDGGGGILEKTWPEGVVAMTE